MEIHSFRSTNSTNQVIMKLLTRKPKFIRNASLILAVIAQSFAFSQTCNLVVETTSPTTVCPGTPVDLSATASVTGANQSFNFNIGSLPTGWSVAGGTSFSSPCGAGPDGAYYWASTAGNGLPYIQTAEFDVCTGGNIVFDMRYETQGGNSPCEGPDLAHEGVTLEYSLDGGVTWITIIYFSPGGYTLPSMPSSSGSVASGNTPYTTWGTQTVPIPPGAVSGNTMFRWVQYNSSGTCCDNWGIDNVFINAGPCLNANINWNTGENGVNNVSPVITSDSCIVAAVYDNQGNFLCNSAPFCFTVFDPQIDGGPDQSSICEGGNVVLTASGGTNFSWNNGVVDGESFVSPIGTTTYIVMGQDNNGCDAVDSVDVTVIPGVPFTLDAGLDQEICLGGTANLNATGGASSFSWNNGLGAGASHSVSPTVTTTYVVTGTDGSCSTNDEMVVTVVDPITPTFDPIPDICQGYAVPTLPTTSTNGIDGTWSGVINSSTPGTYNFTFTPTGPTCNPTTQISVNIVPVSSVDAGQDLTVCEGTQVTLTGTGAVNYYWDNNVINGVPFDPPVGDTTEYIVTGTGGNGCSDFDTVTVISVAMPIVDAGQDITICQGQSVTLTATGATTYSWDNSLGAGDTHTFTPPSPGTTTYTVTGTTSVCQDDDEVVVQVVAKNIPEFPATADICQNVTPPDLPLTSENDIDGTWSPSVINTSTPGMFNYTFTPDDTDCNEIFVATITVNPAPVVDAGTYTSVCIDAANIPLSGTPAGGTFSGTGVTGNSFSPSVGTQTITYSYTDPGSGCSGSDDVTITIFDLPNIDAGNDITVCEGQSVTLNGSGGVSYVWTNGGVNGQPFTPGVGQVTYTVTGTDANGCQNSDDVNVNVVDMPYADVTADSTIGYPGLTVNFDNNSSVTNDYLWNYGNGTTGITNNLNPTTTSYSEPGTYNVVLTATNGTCSDYDTVQIIILEFPEPIIEVPNVFTPNNDASNDFFFINTQFTSNISYIIVNRWGNLIFEDEGINPLWNGTTKNGNPVEEGVYFYKYEILGLNGETYTGHGNVTLIRN